MNIFVLPSLVYTRFSDLYFTKPKQPPPSGARKQNGLVPLGKAYKLISDYLITRKLLRRSAHEKPSMLITYLDYLGGVRFWCHDILMLSTSPIQWRQRPGMTITVDRHAMHQFKQTNNFWYSVHQIACSKVKTSNEREVKIKRFK